MEVIMEATANLLTEATMEATTTTTTNPTTILTTPTTPMLSIPMPITPMLHTTPTHTMDRSEPLLEPQALKERQLEQLERPGQ